ncbi:SusD/RagB family nutrient-binding outer membrane lipoprotein [Polaribacter sp. WD7]|uniref:SusD/RagB family nutrient-binding outer membrane lipoprotein n=1 Tax=Polaribacter sp. WD7 TaxID=2269061 RepID=UPI000DF1FCF6|nr:SusD/RagB family nutrient-binding outer membrane lipoprotein [Polaribacter sp. WD7]RCS27500.1 SusD/RagB family nutrient-binding outer membrane lipoprotein [Polaribacter sp. WD7]
MKKITNNIKLIVLLLFSITFVSCEGSLDINEDPLAATRIDASLLYPQFFLQMSSNRTIELNAVNIQAQQWASGGSAGVFRNPERYSISPFTIGNNFTGIYTGVLRNLSLARGLIEENQPANLNSIGQIKVFEAFAYLHITQIYGDAPFTEAIQTAEFPFPRFDAQEDLLRGVVGRLDEAIGLLSSPTDIVTNADLIYSGDRNNWIRFANSLKLKALMLIANRDPQSVAAEIQALSTNPLLILDNSQNAYLRYPGTVGQSNPIWQTLDNFAGGRNPFWYAGSTLVNLMNANNDPRRATYFDEEDGGVYVGQDQGVFSPTGISNISLNIIRPDLEDRFATAAETNFFLAEAVLKGYITGNAQSFYRAGLEASLNSYDGAFGGENGEIAQADKDAYLAARGSISELNINDAIRRVNEEQYVALFTRGLEAWTHWRRTKVPDFQLPTGALLSDIIRRYSYPTDEIVANENSPESSLPLTTPMWFEQP